MKQALRHIMSLWLQEPSTAQYIEHMLRLKDDKGWRAFISFILMLKANIRETPLTKEFLKLDERQKLILLESYHWMDQFLDFMLNPMSVIETQQRIKAHNEKIDADSKGKA